MNSHPDYSTYSISELYDASATVDKYKFPDRYELIKEEIKKKKEEEKRKVEIIPETKEESSSVNPVDFSRFISWYQIVNGSLGLLIIIISLFTSTEQILSGLISSIVSSSLIYILLIIAGFLLLKKQKVGFWLSLILLSIQSFFIKAYFIFNFSSLIKILILYKNTGSWSFFDFNFGISFVSSGMMFNISDNTWTVGINIITIALIIILMANKNSSQINNSV